MVFVEKMKSMKIYKQPCFLPTSEGNKKKDSAIILLTPSYESSKNLMNNSMFINKKRFESYFLDRDVSYYISNKKLEEVDESFLYLEETKRSELKDSDFGIPEDRKFPLDTEEHVRSAIKLFGHAEESKKKSLAKRISRKASKYGIKIPDTTQCYKYLHEAIVESFQPAEEDDNLDFKFSVPDTDIIDIKFEMDEKEKRWNSIVLVEGVAPKTLRGRSECLVIRDNMIYLDETDSGICSKGGIAKIMYDVPGGGWDPNEPHDICAIRETNEEAKIDVKDVQYIDNYLTIDKVRPEGCYCDGLFSKVYIGKYAGKYTGPVADVDRADIAVSGSWYPIDEVYDKLNPIHKKAIDIYFGREPELVEFESPVDEAAQVNTKTLYHLSLYDLDGRTISPTVPKNYLTKNGYEDKEVKRVCFSTSIDGCLMGLSQNLTGKEYYVYTPDDISKYNVMKPDVEEVPDSKVTNEHWICSPVTMKMIGKIRVIDSTGDPIPYTYGEYTAELYPWNWKWIEKNHEAIFITEDSPDKSELDKNFKKKSGYTFKYMSVKDAVSEKYIDSNWNREGSEGIIAICNQNNKPAGFVYVNKSGIIGSLKVYDDYRGYGISNELMKQAINNYGGKELGVYSDNQIAINLYKKFGFKDTGKRKKYKDGDEVIFMVKEAAIVNESTRSKSYYRFDYNGEGIYEAYKNLCTKDEWLDFKKSKECTWLPLPDVNYKSGYESWFTETGAAKFKNTTLKVFVKKLDKSKINITKVTDILEKYKLIYKDKYQVVVDTSSMKADTVSTSLNKSILVTEDSIQKSELDSNFKKKSISDINYEVIDFHSPKAKKYIETETDSYLSNLYNKNQLKDFNGEIIADKDNGTVIGRIFIGTGKDKGYIGALRVYDKYKGYGFGDILIKDAINKYGGYDLNVFKDNEVALKMYKNYGFEVANTDSSDGSYYMKLKSRLNEAYIEEGVFMNKKDAEFNLSSWKPNGKNILFITGLSGSGKSTKAAQLAKENDAVNIELDLVEHNDILFDDSVTQDEGNQILKEFFKKKFGGPKKLESKSMDVPQIMYEAIKYCMKYANDNKGKLFIAEGIQLMDLEMVDELKGYPVIVVNTSIAKSILQAKKREEGSSWKEFFGSWQSFKEYCKWYFNMEKNKNKFIKDMKESYDYLQEGTEFVLET